MAETSDFLNMQGPVTDPGTLMSMAAPLAAKGEQLLATGDPKILAAGKAMQKKLGLDDPKKAQDTLSKLLVGEQPQQSGDAFSQMVRGQAPSSLALQPGMPQPALNPGSVPTMGAKPGAKDVQTKSGQTATQINDAKKTRNSYADPEQAGSLMDTLRNTPEAQAQREGITKMEQLLAMNQASARPNDAWIKPLLAYGDSLNGTNQAASFEPQAAKQKESMLKFANDIQTQKGNYAKSIEDALAKLKTGSDQNSMVQKLMEQAAINSGQGANARGSAYLKALPIRAGQDFDKQLKDTTNSVEALNRGDSFLNDPRIPLTYQSLNQVQQDISKGLIGTGSPTDAKTAMDMQQVFEGVLQNLKTKYSGKFDPAKDDLRTKIPEVAAQINKGLQKIRSDMNDRVNRDTEQIRQTYEPSFADVPNLEATVKQKIAAIQKRHPRSGDYSDSGIFKAPDAAGGNQGKTKMQSPDGKEQLWVDAADVPHAKQDKWVEVK